MNLDDLPYNPVIPNYYNYIAKQIVSLNDDINFNLYKNINICSYEVNNDGTNPFLKFLLVKNLFLQELSFPKISILYNDNLDHLINLTKKYMYEILLLEDYTKFEEEIDIDGFYEYENELFLFIDITKCKIIIDDVYYTNNVWFAIVDEIINKRHLCNLPINSLPYRFLNNNYNFCTLLNENNEAYEVPIVGYVSKPSNKLNFTYIFGESSKDRNAILGPYYYFSTDFKNTEKEGYELSKILKNKCGIVRFALFAGKIKYIENLPNDENDNSEIKQQRLNDDNLDKNIEILTMRISDHDGKWSESSDSCYLGYITLDNGLFLANTPLIVLKEYQQQVPLSYHYI
jgi:hypothetical protein